MARLLDPDDFGIIALVLVLYNFFSQVSGFAFSRALIQNPDLSVQQASNFFWLVLSLSTFFGLGVIALGPILAGFYDHPELIWLGLGYGLMLVLDGTVVLHRALIQRAMRYEVLFWASLITSPFSLAGGVALALAGAGVYALLAQAIIGGLGMRLIILKYVGWQPYAYDRGTRVRSLVRFGGLSFFAQLVDFVYRQSQVFILGRFASVADIGFYNRGQALFQRPLGQLMNPLIQVFFPVLAARQHNPAAVERFILQSSWLLAFALIPMLIVVTYAGPQIAILLLGPEWLTAGEVMSCFALVGMLSILVKPVSQAFSAMGAPAKALSSRIALLPLFLVSCVWAAPQGAVAVAWIYVSIIVLNTPLSIFLLLRRSKIRPMPVLLNMLAIIFVTSLTYLGVGQSRIFFDRFIESETPPLLSMLIALTIAAYLIYYLAGLCLREPRELLLGLVKKIGKLSRKTSDHCPS